MELYSAYLQKCVEDFEDFIGNPLVGVFFSTFMKKKLINISTQKIFV